jgi:hypothetical protein
MFGKEKFILGSLGLVEMSTSIDPLSQFNIEINIETHGGRDFLCVSCSFDPGFLELQVIILPIMPP